MNKKTRPPLERAIDKARIHKQRCSELSEFEKQRLINMGRYLERDETMAHVRYRMKQIAHLRFDPEYQVADLELSKMEAWLKRRGATQ